MAARSTNAQVVEGIKRNPDSRRHIGYRLESGGRGRMALPPCHCLFSSMSPTAAYRVCSTSAAPIFSSVCLSTSRPYALLTQMMAQVTNYKPGEFVHVLGDAHLYQSSRTGARAIATSAKAACRPSNSIRDWRYLRFTYNDIAIENYDPHPHIAGQSRGLIAMSQGPVKISLIVARARNA